MSTSKDDLIGWRRRIAADEYAQLVHTGPAREILVRHSLATVLGEPRVQKIGQQSSLFTREAEHDRAAPAPHSAVVVLPQRMVIAHTRFRALLIIETDIKTPRERIHGVKRAARTQWQEVISTIKTGPRQYTKTRAKFESCSAVHSGYLNWTPDWARGVAPSFRRRSMVLFRRTWERW